MDPFGWSWCLIALSTKFGMTNLNCALYVSNVGKGAGYEKASEDTSSQTKQYQ